MGVDAFAAKWLVKQGGWAGSRVLSIGRQNWWLSRRESRAIGLPNPPAWGRNNYSEGFWEWLGAECSSVDLVPDERPDYLADLGVVGSLSRLGLRESFDRVVDFGTAEHVADQGAYWGNVWDAVRPGGSVYGILPADGLCGHGLYQFSPEFFHAMGGFQSVEVGFLTYGPRIRWSPAPYGGRFQRRFRWPTYVTFSMVRRDDPFVLPKQFQDATTPTTAEKPWAKWLVEVPGVRVLERIKWAL